MTERTRDHIFLAVILLAALLLRLYHIDFGRPFLYHADEIKLVAQAGRLFSTYFMDKQVHFAIGTYPPFYIYMLTIPFAVYIGFNLLTGRFDSLADARSFYELSPFPFYLAGRLLVVILGVLSVYVLYRLVRRLYSRRLALLAAALLAVNFVHVQNSHYSTVDLPASFFTLLAVYFAARILQKQNTSSYMYSGLFSSLALATKFSMIFAIVPALYAHLYHHLAKPFSWRALLNRKLLLLLLAAVIGFMAACPLFLLDFQKARAGLVETGQFEKEGKLGSGGTLFSYWTGDQSQGFGVFYPNDLPATLGWVLVIFTLAGLIRQIVRRQPADVLLLSFTLLTYVLFESMAYKAIRHLLPIMPFFMLAAAMAIHDLAQRLSRRPLRQAAIMAGIVLGLALLQGGKTVRYFSALAQEDPRTSARRWIMEHLADGSGIVTEAFPPTLPNAYDPKSGESVRYRLLPVKLTSRTLGRSDEFIRAIQDSSMQYYIADGFSRSFFDWKYSQKKYPAIVAERKRFFAWVESQSQVLKTFTAQDPHIQPDIVIYQFKTPLSSSPAVHP